jgi:type I restriction enzyme S subunit
MAQTIFRSWFLDFEPWGIIPDDWRMIKLAEAGEFTSGYSYKEYELKPPDMAIIKNLECVIASLKFTVVKK